MATKEVDVTPSDGGQRIDIFLARVFPEDLSRSQVKHLILQGAVLVNQKPVKPHYAVKPGDAIKVDIIERGDDGSRGEDIPLDIRFEDDHLIVLNKAAGIVVHPGSGNPEHTLVNALLFHTNRELSTLGGSARPGIVHRLDKDTSGILIVAKNNAAHRALARQFRQHSVKRVYQALVKGVVQHDEMKCGEPVGRAFLNRKKIIIKPSGGKQALTFFRVIERFKQATFIEARPETGRTHQIRVHLSHLGHPVLGDPLYGGHSPLITRHALHARLLEFTHPVSGERMSFSSDLPADMQQLLIELRK